MVSASAGFLRYSREITPKNAALERYINATSRRRYIVGPKCIFGRPPRPLEVTRYLTKSEAELRSKNVRVLQKYELLEASKVDKDNIYLELAVGLSSTKRKGKQNNVEPKKFTDFQTLDAVAELKIKDSPSFGVEKGMSPFTRKTE